MSESRFSRTRGFRERRVFKVLRSNEKDCSFRGRSLRVGDKHLKESFDYLSSKREFCLKIKVETFCTYIQEVLEWKILPLTNLHRKWTPYTVRTQTI